MDIRRILIIFVVAILFGVFSFSLIDAIYPNANYDNFCREEGILRNPKPAPMYTKERPASFQCPPYDEKARDQCITQTKGDPIDEFDQNGCPNFKACSICSKTFSIEQNKHDFWAFIMASLLGFIAVVLGLYLPSSANPLHEWIGTGFMLGGLADIFIGTGQYFSELHRIARPIVIFFELALVIFVAYKYLGPRLKGTLDKQGSVKKKRN